MLSKQMKLFQTPGFQDMKIGNKCFDEKLSNKIENSLILPKSLGDSSKFQIGTDISDSFPTQTNLKPQKASSNSSPGLAEKMEIVK